MVKSNSRSQPNPATKRLKLLKTTAADTIMHHDALLPTPTRQIRGVRKLVCREPICRLFEAHERKTSEAKQHASEHGSSLIEADIVHVVALAWSQDCRHASVQALINGCQEVGPSCQYS